MELMRAHPPVGASLLDAVADLRPVAPIVRQHHEHYDGTGYPDGLAGGEILLEARIITATNAWSAMTSDHLDRRRLTPDAALLELDRLSGTRLDPRVVDALKSVLADQRQPNRAGDPRDRRVLPPAFPSVQPLDP